MNKSFYYIAYSFIEEQKSANQIQSKDTYENLKKINPSFRGIFLGNQKSLFWKIRKEKDKYFIDRTDYKTGIIEKYLKIGILRKNLFPYLFAWKVGRILKRDRNKKNIYVRLTSANEGIFYLKRLNEININRIVFELHNLNFDIPDFYYWNFEKKYCYRKYVDFFNLLKNNPQGAKLVTLTKGLADEIRNRFDYKQNIEVIPDAHNFVTNKTKNINFNKGKIEIIYTGLSWKFRGIEDIIKVLEFLPDRFYFRLVGGGEQERKRLKKRYHSFVEQERLILEEPVPYSKIKEKLINADIGILPSPQKGFSSSTSPLKLFEYMSIGLPIVASDMPVFKEILSEDSALFFKPEDNNDLAKKIEYLAENQKLAQKISRGAFIDAKKYTYKIRAKKIIDLFNS
jgi:glycosyltransferase involved in cell wall biosynthesis